MKHEDDDKPPYPIIDPKAHFTYLQIPYWLVINRDISWPAKIVYARLVHCAKDAPYAFPRQDTIARELNMTNRAVRLHLLELRRYGLLWRKQRGLTRSNVYYFLDHPCRRERMEGVPHPFYAAIRLTQTEAVDVDETIFDDA